MVTFTVEECAGGFLPRLVVNGVGEVLFPQSTREDALRLVLMWFPDAAEIPPFSFHAMFHAKAVQC
jgi:hypothetical protein